MAAALACAALAAVATAGASSYSADETLLVGRVRGDFLQLRAGGQQAETFAQLATTRTVLAGAVRRLGGRMSVAELEDAVTAKADVTTRLLTLTASARSPEMAAASARAVATELRAATRGRSGRDAMQVVDPAQPPAAGGAMAEKLIVLAALAGALAGLAVLVVIDATRRRIVAEDDLALATTAPVLGALPRGRRATRQEGRLAARLVARRALAAVPDRPATLLLVAAAGRGGTADVALQLASSLAEDRVVAVIDASQGQELTRMAGLAGHPGLADALAASQRKLAATLDDALVEREPHVLMLPAGTRRARPFDARAGQRLLTRLHRAADVVLVASGRVEESGAADWAPLAGGVLVATAPGRTTVDGAARTVDALAFAGVPVGTVLAPPQGAWRRALERRRLLVRRAERGPVAAAPATSPS